MKTLIACTVLFVGQASEIAALSQEVFLDEVQDRAYSRSTLHGDPFIEFESTLPRRNLIAEEAPPAEKTDGPASISLSGLWELKGGAPMEPSNLAYDNWDPEEPQGVREGWYLPGHDRADWFQVEVPTSVQSALIKMGEYKDPFWDDNTYVELHQYGTPKDAPEWRFRKTRIEQKEWWFARTFLLPDEWKDAKVELHFNGIDYAGSFYLNGFSLGYHEGMFGGPTYNVTKVLNRSGENILVVRLEAARDTWFGNMKGSPGWGWHYGHLISTGIWKDVLLRQIPSADLVSPFIRTLELEDKEARLLVQYDIRSQMELQTEVIFSIVGKTFEGPPATFRNEVDVHVGLNRFVTALTLRDPQLWWPMNYGKPDLYTAHIEVRDAHAAVRLDTADVDFGIRTLRMDPVNGAAPERDYRWQFVINDVPMFIKGANWCWSDPLLEVNPAKYEHLLELTRRAGVQMLRSWGGGIVETETFYRKCDEKGILVYQEFPFCWRQSDFPVTDALAVDQQVVAVVKQLRNHPSLVMWGGANESTNIEGNDEVLSLIGRRCRQFDPSRPFHRTAPWGGSLHNWDVYHQRKPLDSGLTGQPTAWLGEFGIPSMTNWRTTLKYWPERKLQKWPPEPRDGGILMHMNEFSLLDMIKTMRYADYGPIADWRDYIEYSQMAQGDMIAFATNLQRAGSYANRGGLWFYKMTDLFPGHSWAVIDFYGHPKLSYYRAKQFYQPQAAFLATTRLAWAPDAPFEAELHVSNDTKEKLLDARADAVLYDNALQCVWSDAWDIPRLNPSERCHIQDIRVPISESQARPFLVNVRLTSAHGKRLSDQWCWFNFKNKTNSVKALEARTLEELPGPESGAATWAELFQAYARLPQKGLLYLPRTKLQAAVSSKGEPSVVRVVNLGTVPALNVLIESFPHEYGAFLEDNSFSLRPRETRTLSIKLPSDSPGLDELRVRGWNALPVTPSSVEALR